MRLAVISDIHANLPALEAVLERVDAAGADQLICLGDLVGYGPYVNEVCDLIRARADLCLAGNHDFWAVHTERVLNAKDPVAAAIEWAQGSLSGENVAWLRRLEASFYSEPFEAYHGSARDPWMEFVSNLTIAKQAMRLQRAPLALYGHTHAPACFRLQKRELKRIVKGFTPVAGELIRLGGFDQLLLNPGAVGRPQKDRDPRAWWLLVDLEAERAVWEPVEYEIERTQAEIRACGLPEWLASSLARIEPDDTDDEI